MFRHLLKPLWKRKGRNLLLSVEIALAFAVVFAIAAGLLRHAQLYREPVGLQWQDVWAVQLLVPDADGGKPNFDTAVYARFKQALERMPEVEKVGFAAYTPYENSEWNTSYWSGNREIESNVMQVTDDFFAVMGITPVAGRAFSAADDGASPRPVVINRRLAESAFPGQDALGQVLADGGPEGKDRRLMKVVGIVEAFRNQGEYMAPVNFTITRFDPTQDPAQMRSLLLKLRPGTPRSFEAALSRQLKLVRNDWSYQIAPMRDMRDDQLRGATLPLKMLGVLAAFLLFMVAFGLFGVLWQNTTRRVPEIGLRRAVGATAAGIYSQIVIEQVLLCLLPILAALLLLAQLPITGALGEALTWPLFLAAGVLAAAVMVLVSVACALYPAWRASRLSPSEALHYE
jgi:putative ABC transport system permease protein